MRQWSRVDLSCATAAADTMMRGMLFPNEERATPMTPRTRSHRLSVGLAAFLLLLWGVNTVWTFSLSAQYGGSALDGGVRDRQYYVAQHGTHTQVRLHEMHPTRRMGSPQAQRAGSIPVPLASKA
jgi:hypothetical protein